MAITNLEGYIITVPPNWSASAGEFSDVGIEGSCTTDQYGEISFDTMRIGYSYGFDDLPYEPYADTILFGGYAIQSYQGFTLSNLSGNVTYSAFIQWLEDNDAIFTATATPSTIRGAAVPNATAYNLYEKVTTGQTVEYVFKATNSEINFDLTTLNLSEGAHTFVVQATAQGYESSDYSNEVTYTAGGGELS